MSGPINILHEKINYNAINEIRCFLLQYNFDLFLPAKYFRTPAIVRILLFHDVAMLLHFKNLLLHESRMV